MPIPTVTWVLLRERSVKENDELNIFGVAQILEVNSFPAKTEKVTRETRFQSSRPQRHTNLGVR